MAIISWKKVQDSLALSEKIRILVKENPNDQELGEKVRKLVNTKNKVMSP